MGSKFPLYIQAKIDSLAWVIQPSELMEGTQGSKEAVLSIRKNQYGDMLMRLAQVKGALAALHLTAFQDGTPITSQDNIEQRRNELLNELETAQKYINYIESKYGKLRRRKRSVSKEPPRAWRVPPDVLLQDWSLGKPYVQQLKQTYHEAEKEVVKITLSIDALQKSYTFRSSTAEERQQLQDLREKLNAQRQIIKDIDEEQSYLQRLQEAYQPNFSDLLMSGGPTGPPRWPSRQEVWEELRAIGEAAKLDDKTQGVGNFALDDQAPKPDATGQAAGKKELNSEEIDIVMKTD